MRWDASRTARTPRLLASPRSSHRSLKKQREMRTLFATLMEEGHKTLGAEHCALYLVDQSNAGRQHGPPTSVALIERGSPPTRASDATDATTDATDADDDLPRLYAMGAHGRPATDHELQRAFAAYDADGSGKIGASELFSAMTKLGRMVSFAQVQWRRGCCPKIRSLSLTSHIPRSGAADVGRGGPRR